jgi:putative endonuclease
MGAYVYMLCCADDSFYVGSATGDDLELRIAQHQTGAYPGYTSKRRPVRLVWSERFDRITDAIAAERQIKGWSRAKKEALIRGDWSSLQQLAKRRAGRPRPNTTSQDNTPDSSS